ncbi:uncharacterized protein [Periplaneta americana]|uniref:uncharacterized protein n=1 Tax=Periplaneta americana TaxID=6978 RepID=UPI0037E8824E
MKFVEVAVLVILTLAIVEGIRKDESNKKSKADPSPEHRRPRGYTILKLHGVMVGGKFGEEPREFHYHNKVLDGYSSDNEDEEAEQKKVTRVMFIKNNDYDDYDYDHEDYPGFDENEQSEEKSEVIIDYKELKKQSF